MPKLTASVCCHVGWPISANQATTARFFVGLGLETDRFPGIANCHQSTVVATQADTVALGTEDVDEN